MSFETGEALADLYKVRRLFEVAGKRDLALATTELINETIESNQAEIRELMRQQIIDRLETEPLPKLFPTPCTVDLEGTH